MVFIHLLWRCRPIHQTSYTCLLKLVSVHPCSHPCFLPCLGRFYCRSHFLIRSLCSHLWYASICSLCSRPINHTPRIYFLHIRCCLANAHPCDMSAITLFRYWPLFSITVISHLSLTLSSHLCQHCLTPSCHCLLSFSSMVISHMSLTLPSHPVPPLSHAIMPLFSISIYHSTHTHGQLAYITNLWSVYLRIYQA